MGQVVSAGTRDQAQETCNRIMDYWGKRGYEVTAYPVPVRTTTPNGDDPDDLESPGDMDEVVGWGVRSNLVNGEPQALHAQRQRAALG